MGYTVGLTLGQQSSKVLAQPDSTVSMNQGWFDDLNEVVNRVCWFKGWNKKVQAEDPDSNSCLPMLDCHLAELIKLTN